MDRILESTKQWFADAFAEKPFDINSCTIDQAVAKAFQHVEAKEYKEAMQIYLKLTEAGCKQVPGLVHLMLKKEDAVEIVFQLCTEKCEQGSKAAPYYLGVLYEKGYYVSKDLVQALSYYSKADRNHICFAADNIATIYELGGKNVERNFKEALKFYQKAKEVSPKACYRMGRVYEKMDNVTKARECYREAVNRKVYNAALRLGSLQQTQQNNQEAVNWYRTALRGGVLGAADHIVDMYKQGDATKGDLDFVKEHLTTMMVYGGNQQQCNQAQQKLTAILGDPTLSRDSPAKRVN